LSPAITAVIVEDKGLRGPVGSWLAQKTRSAWNEGEERHGNLEIGKGLANQQDLGTTKHSDDATFTPTDSLFLFVPILVD
jgi:hypothetical protein